MDDETKSIIRSLVASTPIKSTIRTVLKDFYDTVGFELPFRQLGFNNPEQYLRSIPDVVQIIGSGPNAEVCQVRSQKLDHINELVSKQRLPKTTTNRRRPISRSKVVGAGVHSINPNPPPFTRPPPLRPPSYYNLDVSQNRPLVRFPIRLPSLNNNVFPQTSQQHSITRDVTNTPTNSRTQYEPEPKLQLSPRQPQQPSPSPPRRPSPLRSRQRSPPKFQQRPSPQFRQQPSPSQPRQSPTFQLRPPAPPIKLQHTPKPSLFTTSTPTPVQETTVSQLNVAPFVKKYMTTQLLSVQDEDSTFYDEVEDRVPIDVRNNLQNLIGDHPEGIWCCDLPKLYKSRYLTELDYAAYKFRTLNEMCLYLASIFHYIRPNKGDFKLYDKRKPIPRDLSLETFWDGVEEQQVTTNFVVDAGLLDLELLSVTDEPSNVLHYLEDIPRQWLPHDVTEGSHVDVWLAEVYDPSKFWFILDKEKLDNLMNEMQPYYHANKQRFEIPIHKLREGLYCCAVLFSEYHRALVVANSIDDIDDQIKLYFIDYGTVAKVPKEGICYLHRKFAVMPQQAIRGRLAGVYPVHAQQQWPRHVSNRFFELVAMKKLVAEVVKIHLQKQYVHLLLHDIPPEDSLEPKIYINELLVKEGLAVASAEAQTFTEVNKFAAPIVRHLHFFPSFGEIEQGLVPNAPEMMNLLNNGCSLDLIYPQYYLRTYYKHELQSLRSEMSRSYSSDEEESIEARSSCSSIGNNVIIRAIEEPVNFTKDLIPDKGGTSSTDMDTKGRISIQNGLNLKPFSTEQKTHQVQSLSPNSVPDSTIETVSTASAVVEELPDRSSPASTLEEMITQQFNVKIQHTEDVDELTTATKAVSLKPPPGFERLRPNVAVQQNFLMQPPVHLPPPPAQSYGGYYPPIVQQNYYFPMQPNQYYQVPSYGCYVPPLPYNYLPPMQYPVYNNLPQRRPPAPSPPLEPIVNEYLDSLKNDSITLAESESTDSDVVACGTLAKEEKAIKIVEKIEIEEKEEVEDVQKTQEKVVKIVEDDEESDQTIMIVDKKIEIISKTAKKEVRSETLDEVKVLEVGSKKKRKKQKKRKSSESAQSDDVKTAEEENVDVKIEKTENVKKSKQTETVENKNLADKMAHQSSLKVVEKTQTEQKIVSIKPDADKKCKTKTAKQLQSEKQIDVSPVKKLDKSVKQNINKVSKQQEEEKIEIVQSLSKEKSNTKTTPNKKSKTKSCKQQENNETQEQLTVKTERSPKSQQTKENTKKIVEGILEQDKKEQNLQLLPETISSAQISDSVKQESISIVNKNHPSEVGLTSKNKRSTSKNRETSREKMECVIKTENKKTDCENKSLTMENVLLENLATPDTCDVIECWESLIDDDICLLDTSEMELKTLLSQPGSRSESRVDSVEEFSIDVTAPLQPKKLFNCDFLRDDNEQTIERITELKHEKCVERNVIAGKVLNVVTWEQKRYVGFAEALKIFTDLELPIASTKMRLARHKVFLKDIDVNSIDADLKEEFARNNLVTASKFGKFVHLLELKQLPNFVKVFKPEVELNIADVL